MNELIRLTATEAVGLLKKGEISPVDLLDASIKRIQEVEPLINALPIKCFAHARDEIKKLSEKAKKNQSHPGWIAGLPVAVKDLAHVAGVPTTMGGSPIFKDFVPEKSGYSIQNMENRGAIVVAKSNSPEFGFNATTYNTLWGYTNNPWDLSKSTAGSSGGSAACLATGEVWLATGSDLGTSIRGPAAFCSIVGFRPSPGCVPRGPHPLPFNVLPVEGPMARTVADVALMLENMTGKHYGDPLSVDPVPGSYLKAVREPVRPKRIGFSLDLGITKVHSEVARLVTEAAERFVDMGIEVTDSCPDFSKTIEVFHGIRGTNHIAGMWNYMENNRELLTPEIVWSVENARKQTPDDIARAEKGRGELVQAMTKFFDENDLLICPAAITPPFPNSWHSVEEIEGYKFKTYIDWIAITFAVTLTACPAISVPCGFTNDGLPVGLQIIAKPRCEAELLSAAVLFEESTGLKGVTPIDPKPTTSSLS